LLIQRDVKIKNLRLGNLTDLLPLAQAGDALL
jgi:hypothetical protein